VFQKLLRDPLVHFVGAALLVFGAAPFVIPSNGGEDTIRLSRADIERLASLYAAETGAPPGPDDLRALVIDQVETLALAREARRLGLEDGDVVVERRLAQKMRFMVDDLANPADPGPAELRRWFDENHARFDLPATFSFDHVYFRQASDPRAAQALTTLETRPSTDWLGQGDAFMLQRQYGALPVREVARLFGTEFAEALATLPPGTAWHGPLNSALGTHLVRVTKVSPAESPDFEAVRDDVLEQWRAEARLRANAKAVSDIVARYKVELEGAAP
jgi:peptidyl-prolyl cis-trans isomerase C